jgi:hypothetical protein
MPRTDDSAAYASNWRAVLALDALIGVVTSLVGLVITLAVSAVVGILVVALGAAYTALVGARARRWARMRREGGP